MHAHPGYHQRFLEPAVIICSGTVPITMQSKRGQLNLPDQVEGMIRDRSLANLILTGTDDDGIAVARLIARSFYGDGFIDYFSEFEGARDGSYTPDLRDVIADARRESSPHLFRMIAIRHADKLTEVEQSNLFIIIGSTVAGCRFILLCESTDFLLGDIVERCAVIDIRPLTTRFDTIVI